MDDAEEIPVIVLIDGVCVLCSRSYRFVTRRDDAHHFRFLTIQSPEGHALAERFGVSPEKPDTFVLIAEQKAYFRTEAVLRILCEFPGWRWTSVFRIVPPFIRDAIYNFVARNRYRWFGQ